MRVLLIYSNRTRILEPPPPVGLSYIATATERAGHKVRLLDLMTVKDPDGAVARAIAEFRPDAVGISVRNIDTIIPQRLTRHLPEVESMVREIRRLTFATVVVGGSAVSSLGPEALDLMGADFAVLGEGEIAFPALLEALAEGGDFTRIDGLVYREGDEVRWNRPRDHVAFGASGLERWVDWKRYERAGGTFAIHTKRGCPLGCIYCNYPGVEGRHSRLRDPADVAEEIARVKREVNPRTFEFTDSTFNMPADHAAAICEEIIRRNLKVRLSAVGVNPGGVSPELIGLMKRAGFINIVVTLDSASETMLRNLHKSFGVDAVRETARLVRASGIRCTWFFLLGGPGETRETVEETLAFAEGYLDWPGSLVIVMTGLRILPKTPLAEMAVAQGLMSPDRDLSQPTFYFSPEVSEEWVLRRVTESIARVPAMVHGGEENGSAYERAFTRALNLLGVAPPYIRFLPDFLRTPPLPALRARGGGVVAAAPGMFVGEGKVEGVMG